MDKFNAPIQYVVNTLDKIIASAIFQSLIFFIIGNIKSLRIYTWIIITLNSAILPANAAPLAPNNGIVKIECGLAKGKKLYDKRESLKQKSAEMEIKRYSKKI